MEITLDDIKDIFEREVDARVNVKNMDPDKSISDQGVDSLDTSSVFLEIEEHFSIKITDSDIERLDTLNKILEFLIKNKN